MARWKNGPDAARGVIGEQLPVLPDVLAISDMIAVVPSRIAENQTGMFVCDTPVPVPGFTKCMARHARTHRNPAQMWLRGLLLETCQRA